MRYLPDVSAKIKYIYRRISGIFRDAQKGVMLLVLLFEIYWSFSTLQHRSIKSKIAKESNLVRVIQPDTKFPSSQLNLRSDVISGLRSILVW